MSKQIIDRGVMVPMRDGVKLAADIYRPDDGGEHPVLITTVMGSRTNATLVGGYLFSPLMMLDKGYAVVVFEARCRCDSEGVRRPFIDDQRDGYDRVEWAAAQPWSNGSVG